MERSRPLRRGTSAAMVPGGPHPATGGRGLRSGGVAVPMQWRRVISLSQLNKEIRELKMRLKSQSLDPFARGSAREHYYKYDMNTN